MGFQPMRQYLIYLLFLSKNAEIWYAYEKLIFKHRLESIWNQNVNTSNLSILRCVDTFLVFARQSVSRVLSFKRVIYLGLNSHLTSSNQPR